MSALVGAGGNKPAVHASRTKKGRAGKAKARVRPKAVMVSPVVRQQSLSRVSRTMSPGAGHFENPEALEPFFRRLALSRSGGEAVHILQFGDSHTASDDWVDAMRQVLQSRYGNG